MRLLQDDIPDILFLDLLMPCKDGHECPKRNTGDKRYDSMPISASIVKKCAQLASMLLS